MRKKVLVPVARGVEELETVGVVDVLRRAGLDVTVAATSTLEITASRGTKLVADKLLSACSEELYDLIVVPGGPGVRELRSNRVLSKLLKAQQEAGRFYAGICAAPVVVLQHHGLLEDLVATCHPSMWEELHNPSQERVVVSGRAITSQGPGTVLEFALKLIELLLGSEVATTVATAMVI